MNDRDPMEWRDDPNLREIFAVIATSEGGLSRQQIQAKTEFSNQAVKNAVSMLVDRGFITASRGSTQPPTVVLPAPVHVVGVLSLIYMHPGSMLAPYTIVAERETPAPPGISPAPYPDPRRNLQYVGACAPTWFGLAAVVAGVYAAMLWRRRRPKA